MPTSDCNYDQGVLAALGFGRLSDDETTEAKLLAMRELYGLCRNAGADAKFPEADRTFGADWINLSKSGLTELVFACVALDDPAALRDARKLVKRELEARDWNTVLGFDEPVVRCCVRLHGQDWGIRFQSDGSPRGRELRNGQLPPAIIAPPDRDDTNPPPAQTGEHAPENKQNEKKGLGRTDVTNDILGEYDW